MSQIRNAKRPNCFPYTNYLDLDFILIGNKIILLLAEEIDPGLVFFKGFRRIVFGMDVLIIVLHERRHRSWFENPKVAYQSRSCTNSICASRESEEE
jgi:hypothetical protein